MDPYWLVRDEISSVAQLVGTGWERRELVFGYHRLFY